MREKTLRSPVEYGHAGDHRELTTPAPHEILEDAQRDLLSDAAVPWSHQGVLGTAAGLAATREIVATLRPLSSRHLVGVLNGDLGQLTDVLDSLAKAHGDALPTNPELSQTECERLSAALGQALEGLAQVPTVTETQPTPKIPAIPAGARRSSK